jgi:diguanylate cyclase (GGDEF)-like protein
MATPSFGPTVNAGVLAALLAAEDTDLVSLAVRSRRVPISAACEEVERLFRAHRELACVVVSDPQHNARLGLVTRARFDRKMSGRLGYGRALWARRQIGQLTDWAPLLLETSTSLAEAAHAIARRTEASRYDDVLVYLPDRDVGQVATAEVLLALAGQLALHAVRDGLTGLASRAHFFDRLLAICAEAHATGVRPVVIYLDLDRMKAVNDSLGHGIGDALLRSVGRRLLAASRAEDLIARLGGDEFAVLCVLPRARRDVATVVKRLAERLRDAVAAPDPDLDPRARSSASVGAAVAGERADAETLLREADLAMYQAKRSGTGQVVISTDVEPLLDPHDQALEISPEQALAGGQLRLHYQPIVRLSDGRVVSVEALVRWQHPMLGLLTPARFLAVAEREGLTGEIDEWVLTRACRDFAGWIDQLGPAAPDFVNINISTATLANPNAAEIILAAATRTGLDPSRVRIELPETADFDVLQTAAPALESLRRHGVKLTLDDMGAAASSLRHLSALHIDGLKIDRSLIAGMDTNERDHAVVELLIDFGLRLGLFVTAEGVETEEQLQELRRLGVGYAQGYHLSRPLPATEVPAHLAHVNDTAGKPSAPPIPSRRRPGLIRPTRPASPRS